MGLKQNVINALVSTPAKWVNFSFANRMIAPIGFYHLATLVHTGEIKCRTDSSVPERTAKYDPGSNAIIAHDHSVGENYLDEKALLIHESAHAILDRFYAGRDLNGNPSSMKVVDDETMGYLAGAIYLIAAGQGSVNGAASGQPDQVAIKIAKPKVKVSMDRGWDGCYTIDFSRQDVTGLQTAIKSHDYYKDDWHHQAQHDG